MIVDRPSMVAAEAINTQVSKKFAYLALKKNSTQVNIGRAGKKNCLVTGMSRASMSNADAPVFVIGPGAWLIESENMVMMINTKYFAS